jgi:predicted CoA-substrate-specific enzyme activase
MITAGIDVGLESVKVVILDGGKVRARATCFSGGEKRAKAIDAVWAEALNTAGISADDVVNVIATGQGKHDVAVAGGSVVEAVADARAARFVDAKAASVVDIGADQTRVVTLGAGNAVEEVVFNQKCMAGLGLLLETVASRLELSLEAMGSIPAGGDVVANDGCPVFAELDALEFLNNGVPKDKIAGAVTEVAVVRLNSILKDKVVPAKDSTVLIGGVAKNKSVVDALKKRSGIEFIIPEAPEYGGALGAAVVAADQSMPKSAV